MHSVHSAYAQWFLRSCLSKITHWLDFPLSQRIKRRLSDLKERERERETFPYILFIPLSTLEFLFKFSLAGPLSLIFSSIYFFPQCSVEQRVGCLLWNCSMIIIPLAHLFFHVGPQYHGSVHSLSHSHMSLKLLYNLNNDSFDTNSYITRNNKVIKTHIEHM